MIGAICTTTKLKRNIAKKDPKGWHVTVSYKEQEHVESDMHLTCHAYVDSQGQCSLVKFEPRDANGQAIAKADGIVKANGRRIWPLECHLVTVPTEFVAQLSVTEPDYSHFVALMRSNSSTVETRSLPTPSPPATGSTSSADPWNPGAEESPSRSAKKVKKG
ncbi:hypothetical protein E4U52_007396 [Claviceps spartinae]|nr:hypothetical protein E4U52_007396 [Claviceps spartinae]